MFSCVEGWASIASLSVALFSTRSASLGAPVPAQSLAPCEILSMTPPFWAPLPSPPTSHSHTASQRTWGSRARTRGHTHPSMQWAAVTTHLWSMRAPPHTCWCFSRRLTCQGQWRVTFTSSDHQGLPQALGTNVPGRHSDHTEEEKTETKMPRGSCTGCELGLVPGSGGREGQRPVQRH